MFAYGGARNKKPLQKRFLSSSTVPTVIKTFYHLMLVHANLPAQHNSRKIKTIPHSRDFTHYCSGCFIV